MSCLKRDACAEAPGLHFSGHKVTATNGKPFAVKRQEWVEEEEETGVKAGEKKKKKKK